MELQTVCFGQGPILVFLDLLPIHSLLFFSYELYRFWEERKERDLSFTGAIPVSCCQDRAADVSTNYRLTYKLKLEFDTHKRWLLFCRPWICWVNCLSLLTEILLKVCSNLSLFCEWHATLHFQCHSGSHGHSSKHTSCLNWKRSWRISTLPHQNREDCIIPM